VSLPALPKLLSIAITGVILISAAAGCSGGSDGPDVGPARSSHNGVMVTIPASWQKVRLVDLPGAEVPLEIATFKVRGGVGTICDPHRTVSQIPAGGALLQILQDSGVKRQGAGAVSQASEIRRYPALRRPFHLGALQSHECGEAYNLWFREGGRLFQLRIWSAQAGLSPVVRAQIERLMDGIQVVR
jgi:hypothetical protein